MPINVIDIVPQDNTRYIPIDQNITIEFDAPVDPFTVPVGISLYTASDGIWSGPDLSQLDSQYSDSLSIGEEYIYYQYDYVIDGNKVIITPKKSLFPNKTHVVQVLPGEDVTRYISILTFSTPTYTRTLLPVSTGELEVLSSYTGAEDSNYSFTFSKDINGNINLVDILKGSEYLNQITIIDGQDIQLEDIKIRFTGFFNEGDTVSLDVFAPTGVSQVYKATFTTVEYTTSSPTRSKKITTLSDLPIPLRVVDSKPADQSINNTTCNPIVIRCDRPIRPGQDFKSLIKIKKIDLNTGEERYAKFHAMVNGNIVKLYLTGLE